MDDFERVAHESLKEVRAYLSYQGSNKEYLQRAKISATVIAGYTRHFASLTNRDALSFAVRRYNDEQKALPSAERE